MKNKKLIFECLSLVITIVLLFIFTFSLQGQGLNNPYIFNGNGLTKNWDDVFNWNFDPGPPGPTVEEGEIVRIASECVIPSHLSVDNYGEITIGYDDLDNHFDFIVDGHLDVYDKVVGNNTQPNTNAEIITRSGGVIRIHPGGSLYTEKKVLIEGGGALINGGLFQIKSTFNDFIIAGAFYNLGNALIRCHTTIHPLGFIENESTLNFSALNAYTGYSYIWIDFNFINLGQIQNRPSSSFQTSISFVNQLGGQIINEGSFKINSSQANPGIFNNLGTITNNAASGTSPPGEFIIKHDFTNNSLFNSYGVITIDDDGEFTVASPFNNLSGGEVKINEGTFNVQFPITNGGQLNVNNSGNFNINTTFNNVGDININSGGHLDNNSTFTNNKNLTISQGGTLDNDGFLNHQVGGNFQINGTFTNNDVFWNADNVFVNTDGNFINVATFNNFSTSTFGTSGIFTSNSAGLIINTGILNTYSAGTSTISGSFSGHGDILNNGTIQLLGTMTSDGEFTNNGTLNINTFGTLSNNDFLNNTGNLIINGTFTNNDIQDNSGTLNIETGGLYTNDSEFNNWSAGTFTNKGVFHNMGTHLNNGGQSTTSSGTYSGSGMVTGGLDNILGVLSPGSSPGLLTATGNLSLKSTGSLKIEIAGTGAVGTPTGFDQVNVNGGSLAGTLEIILLNGFVPTVGDPYIILSSTNPITGTFDNITLPDGHDFIITYNTNDVTIQYAGALPVELISFRGGKINDHVQLDWQTASELNNAGFDIQRMDRNKTWETIGFVNGKGTTVFLQEYHFIDRTARDGDNYYRLKQIDFDGQFEFSKVVSVRLNPKTIISIYPNPAQDYIQLSGLSDQLISVQVWDQHGKLHLKKTLNNEQNKLDLTGLPNGTYFIQYKEGGKIVSQKILVLSK